MVLALYNTLTRKKERFVPLQDKRFRIYDCGPTVWAEQHIGNLYRYDPLHVLRVADEEWVVSVRRGRHLFDLPQARDGETVVSLQFDGASFCW